jgi:hypothetical protein
VILFSAVVRTTGTENIGSEYHFMEDFRQEAVLPPSGSGGINRPAMVSHSVIDKHNHKLI